MYLKPQTKAAAVSILDCTPLRTPLLFAVERQVQRPEERFLKDSSSSHTVEAKPRT
jgi:hypothetical protein